MSTAALTNSLTLATRPSGFAAASRVDSRDEFASMLGRQSSAAATPKQTARESAEQFVAIALIQPLLKQLRDSNNAAPPFAPSSGEKQFQSLYDGQIAQRIASASRFPLVDRIAEDLMKRARGSQEAEELPAKTHGPEALAT